MAAPIQFGSLSFRNKTAAREGFCACLQTSALNEPIGEPWHSALLALLLDWHPTGIKKIGSGVKHFEVRTHLWQDKFLQRGFYIVRHDGTLVDFSYILCFQSKASLAKAMI